MPIDYYERKPRGFQQITVSSTAVGLTPPVVSTGPGPNYAFITCETNDVRWRADGTDPTAAVGQLLKAGSTMEWDAELAAVKFIRVTADATLDVSYFS